MIRAKTIFTQMAGFSFLSLLLVSNLNAQVATVAPLSIHFVNYPDEIDGYQPAGNSQTEYAPSLRLHQFFHPHWSWFMHLGLVGYNQSFYNYDENFNFTGNNNSSSPISTIDYFRLDMSTHFGAEFWTAQPDSADFILRASASMGFDFRLIESQTGFIDPGLPAGDIRITASIPLNSKLLLSLFYNKGIKMSKGDWFSRSGPGLSLDYCF